MFQLCVLCRKNNALFFAVLFIALKEFILHNIHFWKNDVRIIYKKNYENKYDLLKFHITLG
jgi:hypothetical protein